MHELPSGDVSHNHNHSLYSTVTSTGVGGYYGTQTVPQPGDWNWIGDPPPGTPWYPGPIQTPQPQPIWNPPPQQIGAPWMRTQAEIDNAQLKDEIQALRVELAVMRELLRDMTDRRKVIRDEINRAMENLPKS
jgi:hypothetical protein